MISTSDSGHQRPARPTATSPFLSPKELAERWRCARSSVDRIARRAGLGRVYLGGGRRGMVRYIREEVERYEKLRLA